MLKNASNAEKFLKCELEGAKNARQCFKMLETSEKKHMLENPHQFKKVKQTLP